MQVAQSYDKPEQIVVFQFPDGTIQLGTQPQNRERKPIQCWSCKQVIIVSLNFDFVNCFHCSQLNNIEAVRKHVASLAPPKKK